LTMRRRPCARHPDCRRRAGRPKLAPGSRGRSLRANSIGLAVAGCAALLMAAPDLTSASLGEAHAASFDCARAAKPSERAICGNPALSSLDAQLGAAYAQRVAH